MQISTMKETRGREVLRSFGKPLGNGTWHISGALLITQKEGETNSPLRQRCISTVRTERENVIETEVTRD